MNEMNKYGEVGVGMTVLVQATDHVFRSLFLASMLLVSFGWSISRSYLPDREKTFATFSITSYLLIGLAHATCVKEANSGSACDFFNAFTYVMRTIILLGIVVALNFSITQLRTILLHSPWVQNIMLQYMRAKQFNTFRSAFLAYLIMPTVILLLEFSILSWRSEWIADLMIQMVDVMIAVLIGASFPPINEQYFSRAFDGSTDSSALRREIS